MEHELPIINFVIGCAACQSKNVELCASACDEELFNFELIVFAFEHELPEIIR